MEKSVISGGIVEKEEWMISGECRWEKLLKK